MQCKTTPLSLRCCSSSEECLTLQVLCKKTPLRAAENCHRKSYFMGKNVFQKTAGERCTRQHRRILFPLSKLSGVRLWGVSRGCELFTGFVGVWAAPKAMGLPALRGPLQSPSLQMSFEVALAACKPEKAGARRELYYWHGVKARGGFNFFSLMRRGHIPVTWQLAMVASRWTKFGSHERTKFSFHAVFCLCSEDPLCVGMPWGCVGRVRGGCLLCAHDTGFGGTSMPCSRSQRGSISVHHFKLCITGFFAGKGSISYLIQTC